MVENICKNIFKVSVNCPKGIQQMKKYLLFLKKSMLFSNNSRSLWHFSHDLFSCFPPPAQFDGGGKGDVTKKMGLPLPSAPNEEICISLECAGHSFSHLLQI